METEGKTLATARMRLAAIAAAHRLGGAQDPTSQPLVKATMKRLAKEYGKPRKQAKGLTNEVLVRGEGDGADTAGRPGQAPAQRDRCPGDQAGRGGPALLQVMRDGLFRRSEASALRWGDVEVHQDGSGRLHILRSKTDQTAEGAVLYLDPAAVEAFLAIRPQEAVIDPGTKVFELSASQISRRDKAATRAAGLGEGFSGHSPRVCMAQDLNVAGAELPELMTPGMGQPDDADQVHQGPSCWTGAVAQYNRGGLRSSRAPECFRTPWNPTWPKMTLPQRSRQGPPSTDHPQARMSRQLQALERGEHRPSARGDGERQRHQQNSNGGQDAWGILRHGLNPPNEQSFPKALYGSQTSRTHS